MASMPLVFRFGEYRYTITFSHEKMKLRLKFGKFNGTEEELLVTWDGDNIKNFPIISLYKSAYWSFVFYDTGVDVDYDCLLSETRASALPVDAFGQPFPVTNLHEYFKLDSQAPFGPCECGAKFTAFPTIHAYYCPQWSE